MRTASDEKSYTLKPSWKLFFWQYLLSIVAIPIAGLGLIALYYVRKKHHSIRYLITDTTITAVDPEYEQNVDLVNIHRIKLRKSRLQQLLGIGRLVLETSTSEMILRGIKNPGRLKNLLDDAVKAQIKFQKEEQHTKPTQSTFKPANTERIDYLTGLWQQGLISEKDYKEERKHFE